MDLLRAKDDIANVCLQAEADFNWADKVRLCNFLRWWGEELEKQSWLDCLDAEDGQPSARLRVFPGDWRKL